jgi:TPR repeat protein
MLLLDRLIGLASPAAALRRAIGLSERGRAPEAFPLLTRSARAGIAEAECLVARSYLEGAGVPPSRAEGARWLERAAAHGYVEAQSMLGALCVHGLVKLANGDAARADSLFVPDEPSEPDFASAAKWARQAGEAGSAKAQALLAYVLTCGPEAMRDLDQAHRWYQRSAAAGCPEGHLGYALSLAPQPMTRLAGARSPSICAVPPGPNCRARSTCWRC